MFKKNLIINFKYFKKEYKTINLRPKTISNIRNKMRDSLSVPNMREIWTKNYMRERANQGQKGEKK